MGYNISLLWDKFKVTSPFGKRIRDMQDTGLGGKVVQMFRDSSVPDLIRGWFGTNDITMIKNPTLAFADRDRKERVYSPSEDDPFVFAGPQSLTKFSEETFKFIKFFTDEWKDLGLPTKMDEDRKIEIPDSEVLLTPTGFERYGEIVEANFEAITLITSNVDIALKFNIVRTITTGWWLQSYSGQDNPKISEFEDAFQIFAEVYGELKTSKAFRSTLTSLENSAGDPLTTNSGYPLFSSEMDKQGRPLAKIRTVNMMSEIGSHLSSVSDMIKYVAYACRETSLGTVPLACAAIRRLQYGWKWTHIFSVSSSGLKSSHDERGWNTVRVAWMVPYILNLVISPLQRLWKATRMLIPGMYREGKVINLENLYVKQHPESLHYIAEADYSNYDRTIARNMVLRINEIIVESSPRKKFWMDMVNFIHTSIPLLWPDYLPGSRGTIWAFRGKIIGLLSGLKITSEEGTLFNLIVNIKAMLIEGKSKEEIKKYLLSFKNDPQSMNIILRVQSDDTLISRSTFKELVHAMLAFMEAAKLANLKASIAIGDRFLMRHMFEGKDSPVLMRIWQNTLSNEEPATDPLKFAVGMAMRTDGLLGHKTIIANNARTGYVVNMLEVKLTLIVMTSLHSFLTTAKIQVPAAIKVVTMIKDEAQRMLTAPNRVASREFITAIDNERKSIVRKLAESELAKNADNLDYMSYIAELLKDASKPSTQALLDQIFALAPELKQLADRFLDREHLFYKYAMDKCKLDPKHY